MGIVYVCETLTDIIQVGYFKPPTASVSSKWRPFTTTSRCAAGKKKVVAVFAAVSLVFCVLAYLGVMDRFGVSLYQFSLKGGNMAP